MTRNPNHPKKNSTIKVEPIREIRDIKSIKKLLADNPRNLCLFVLGINTNLRASDLLRLTAGQVRQCKPGDEITLKEKKTGKQRRITLNKSAATTVQELLVSNPLPDDSPLFFSQRGEVLTVPSVNRLVKSWCRAINLKGNFGSHTLRKTFGYHQRVQLNTSIPELMVMFNHASQKQTLDYLCIQPDEIRDAYMKLEL
ncbi:site-specific integrase [Desulfoprunum benzoelyticum]|uniref:Integrase n=1 Tax=Desulfoprunum benzoelyticum TaxID=1506996 RepID=A0A840V456_9BACT|nr:site-specific integrase [Desulfoprunum benzoelyticum]MBB5349578.1 integrase [Desulfoprunum benzoelyticum]MBM9531334.1 site-specific integrase [Desulfoprunum benzoelyticum]